MIRTAQAPRPQDSKDVMVHLLKTTSAKVCSRHPKHLDWASKCMVPKAPPPVYLRLVQDKPPSPHLALKGNHNIPVSLPSPTIIPNHILHPPTMANTVLTRRLSLSTSSTRRCTNKMPLFRSNNKVPAAHRQVASRVVVRSPSHREARIPALGITRHTMRVTMITSNLRAD